MSGLLILPKMLLLLALFFNINTEKVVELKPDLIVAYKGMHEKYIQLLKQMVFL